MPAKGMHQYNKSNEMFGAAKQPYESYTSSQEGK